MPEDNGSAVRSAWQALWRPYGTHELASTLKRRKHIGLTWFHPLGEVPMPDTGPVVVLNSESWGAVTVDLRSAAVSKFETIHPVSFDYDPATGEINATVKFHELQYAGHYVARRASATGSALKLASKQMSTRSTLAAGADPNDSISLAKSYQDKLASQGQNGQLMLDTYYRNNNSYSRAFSEVPAFAKKWQTYPTNNQTTSFYAQQTQTAASPGNTSSVSVNSGGGASPYNQHAFTMQMFLVAALGALKETDAATAATQFDNTTQQPAQQPQTVDNVMNIVQTTPQPQAVRSAMMEKPEPAWRTQLRAELQPHCDEIRKSGEDMMRGLLLREETGAPIDGQFNSYFPMGSLKLKGVVSMSEGGYPEVVFTSAQAELPEVNVRLGIFPGKMHGDLTAAIDKARFLKSFLGKRVANTVQSSGLLNHIGRLMSLALAERLES